MPWLRDLTALSGMGCLLWFVLIIWPPLTLALLGVMLIALWLLSIPEEDHDDS